MIDFQGLLHVMKATEDRPEENFDMGSWCGTSCCMIGSYMYSNYNKDFKIYLEGPFYKGEKISVGSISDKFGITLKEARFLFTAYRGGKCRKAMFLNKEQALSRLRKFIYYKMHKQEMIVEEGRNKRVLHTGRNIEGRKSVILASKV